MPHSRIRVPIMPVWALLVVAILSFAVMGSFAQTAGDTPLTVPGNPPPYVKAQLDQLQAELRKAEADGDAFRESAALLLIGELYLMTGDSQTAMNNLSRALPIVQSLKLKPIEQSPKDSMGGPEQGVMTAYDVDPTKPLGAWKRAWSTAKKQAGVECRIHDLRHHFISALAQTQTPDATIQAISGHLSRKMLDHYSHVRLEAKRRAVATLDIVQMVQ